MLTKTIFLVLALATVSFAHPLAFENSPSSGNWSWGWEQENRPDISQGVRTNESVLIYTGIVLDVDFEFRGPNLISAVEIFNRNRNDSAGSWAWAWRPEQRGGVHNNYLQLWTNQAESLNATVNIYSTPTNQLIGWKSDRFEVQTSTLQGVTPLRVNFTGNGEVRGVEFIDQTNGTGIYITEVSFINGNIELLLASSLFRSEINFIVNVYLERRRGELDAGRLTANSQLITEEHIFAGDISRDNSFIYQTNSARIDFARLRDLSDGRGSQALVLRILSDNQLIALFDGRNAETTYLLEVYGSDDSQPGPIGPTTTEANEIESVLVAEVGEQQEFMNYLDSRRVYEFGTRALIAFSTNEPIARIEVWNNDVTQGDVQVQVLSGEIGGQVVVVQLETAQPQQISFQVIALGHANDW